MTSINPLAILTKYATSYQALLIIQAHSQAVASKALKIAELFPEADKNFINEAALLHDIGCFSVNAPKIACYGLEPYIKHIIIGYQILLKEGLPRHAKVALNHSGVGITESEIRKFNLPLPPKDYVPENLEEKIISFADLFFSKSNQENLAREETEEEVLADLKKYGHDKVETYFLWKKELKQE